MTTFSPHQVGQDDLALQLLWLLQALAAEAPTERWADTMRLGWVTGSLQTGFPAHGRIPKDSERVLFCLQVALVQSDPHQEQNSAGRSLDPLFCFSCRFFVRLASAHKNTQFLLLTSSLVQLSFQQADPQYTALRWVIFTKMIRAH